MSENESNAETTQNMSMEAAPTQAQTANATPETHRIIEGRDMTYTIPRNQAGVPLVEYFGNAQLPSDLNKAVVYTTPNGPVLSKPDPVVWSQEHDVKASEYATAIRTQIDQRGYYARTLNTYAERLGQETGRPQEEARAVITRSFQIENGKTPREYLTDMRVQRGLPVNEWNQGQTQSRSNQKQGQ